jgi:ParB-like chromosome segregation protein Spo0J
MGLPQAAFNPGVHMVELSKIVPLRTTTPNMRTSRKYRAIASSMQELGMVEPLVVYPAPNDSATYLLLDGHLRVDILRGQGAMIARCLIAKDDEAYTYNKHINPLSTIQEHHMLMKALNDGVSEDRIARALYIDLKTLRQKRELLVGICAEAADLLKDRAITSGCFAVFRKMTALRQIEAAELMITISNYSVALAKTILAASTPDQLVKPGARKAPRALTSEQIAHLEQEMTNSQAGLAALKDTYGAERLELQVACRYLSVVLENQRLRKYLIKQQPDLLKELEQIAKDVCAGESPS